MDDMPALRPELLLQPDPERLEPRARATHPPRILLLYGWLRERSFSRLLVKEADRLLRAMGAETRVFDPHGLPMSEARFPDAEPPARSFWLVRSDDLGAVQALTEAAYAPYTALLASPPLPVTENYNSRVEAG